MSRICCGYCQQPFDEADAARLKSAIAAHFETTCRRSMVLERV